MKTSIAYKSADFILFLLAISLLISGSSATSAADLTVKAIQKGSPLAQTDNWTGFYIFGGGGGGTWNADISVQSTVTSAAIFGFNQRQGGDGWYGMVGAGYNLRAANSWVIGVFADGQIGSLTGTIQDPGPFLAGNIKNDYSWAAGARLGYLVAPNVLPYVNAGYSNSHWKGTTLFDTATGLASGLHTNDFDRGGWFVGGGVENNLNIFGSAAPGWFMKTEYRAAHYDSKNISELIDVTDVSNGRDISFKPFVQSISTSLVYRFNWSGPAVARY